MKYRFLFTLLIGVSSPVYSATLKTSPYTGVLPGFSPGTTVAAAYDFATRIDTGGSGETLEVVSVGTGAVLNGQNSNVFSSEDHINSGFVTNIELVLAQGESVTDQQIAIALAESRFDDGFRIDLNGVTILDFDFGDYSTNADFQSAFTPSIDGVGFNWAPWQSEGNPELTLDAVNGLRLMVTATADGTGSLAGITLGTRFNVLNYFTANTYVSGAQTIDFTAPGGTQLGIYNRNDRGAWSMPEVTLTATAVIVPEPAHGVLLALGMGFLMTKRRRAVA